MTTVGSQDTTGPMTADELKELACLKFQAPMFMQSFCHTAAYPKPADVKMHKNLPTFIAARAGVALRPGDGVIHSWLNRLLLPDTLRITSYNVCYTKLLRGKEARMEPATVLVAPLEIHIRLRRPSGYEQERVFARQIP